MANPTKQASRNLVQLFCTNFESYFDFSSQKTQRVEHIDWSEKIQNSWDLKKVRQICEVFDVVNTSSDREDLAIAVVEFYAPTKLDNFCAISLIVDALSESKLVDSKDDKKELGIQFEKDFENLKLQALNKSKQILKTKFPHIDEFNAETAWINMNGSKRWGAVRTLDGRTYSRI